MHPKVRDALIDHWERMGHTHKEIFGHEKDEKCPRGMALPNSLLYSEELIGKSSAVGGTDNNYRMNFHRTTKGTPFTERIDKLYRILHKGKEFIIYSAYYSGKDFLGNEVDEKGLPIAGSRSKVGSYELPIYRKYTALTKSGPQTVETDDIAGVETVYEIPFNAKEIEKLNSNCHEETMRYLIDGQRKYRIKSQEEWETGDRNAIIAREEGLIEQVKDSRKNLALDKIAEGQ